MIILAAVLIVLALLLFAIIPFLCGWFAAWITRLITGRE
jgi:hypothetical protein